MPWSSNCDWEAIQFQSLFYYGKRPKTRVSHSNCSEGEARTYKRTRAALWLSCGRIMTLTQQRWYLKLTRYSFYIFFPADVTDPSPGFSSREGQKPEGGTPFKNTVLDVCSNRGSKREMGGTDFTWGSGTTGPPSGDDPGMVPWVKGSLSLARRAFVQNEFVH